MANEASMNTIEISAAKEEKGLGFFEKYLYIWVILCILAGILLGKVAPGVAQYLDGLAIGCGDAEAVGRAGISLVEIKAVRFDHVTVLLVVCQDDLARRPVGVLPDALALDRRAGHVLNSSRGALEHGAGRQCQSQHARHLASDGNQDRVARRAAHAVDLDISLAVLHGLL